jgi:type III restriction enzyme
VNPRAALAADRYSADQLLLRDSGAVDPQVVDLAAYDGFIEAICQGRPYQADAIRTVLRLFCGGRYSDARQLAMESYLASPDLQRLYASDQVLIDRLPFPDKLACSLDLATGTGKSYVMYAIARVLLNEGLVDRVLVLCPSLTIETGLTEKFNALTASSDLTDVLPIRPGGHAIPTVVDATRTIQPGEICIENVHAAYDLSGSSLRDSFAGRGSHALVISDEAHHVIAAGGREARKWHDFVASPGFGFRWHLGVSGTCYVGNEYFPDVVYRYAVRDAINDGWVKEVYYLAEDDSTTDHERFQKLLAQHEKNRRTYRPLKPLTIAVTRDISAAIQLGDDLVSFLAQLRGTSLALARRRVLVVTSDRRHARNVARLPAVDDAADPVEWVVSVSKLSEGWDVKNVFQIYPHEKRAFNSKLLVSQVLGRGLRRPIGTSATPIVYVFNHQRWGPEIDEFVAEVLDQDSTVVQRPCTRASAPHFEVHNLVLAPIPQTVKVTRLETNKRLTALKLAPQLDAEEQTRFVSATDHTRGSVLTTRVVERRYPVEEVVAAVRERLLAHDARTGGTLARDYPKRQVTALIRDGLHRVGEQRPEVTQENRQRILNSFGGLRQRTAVSAARLQTRATGLSVVKTDQLRPIAARVARLTREVGVFFDELSATLGTAEDAAALLKAEQLPMPRNLYEVDNPFDFKSPTNVVISDHQPELRFVRRLVQHRSAVALSSWVKAPDVGFYEIEYTFQEGGTGRSKRGAFNPDFFLLLAGEPTVAVVEVKADGDDSWRNVGKLAAARQHFRLVNELLDGAGDDRRYVFHLVTPRDYDKFFETLRAGGLAGWTSGLEGILDGMIA